MQVLTMSRDSIEDYALTGVDATPSIVITINNIGGMPPFVVPMKMNGIKDILKVEFNTTARDVVMDGAITSSTADKIAKFVADNANKVFRIIVACDEGQHRSPAVVKAIMEYLNADNENVPKIFQYCILDEEKVHMINELVYQKMKEAFERIGN